MNDRREFIKKAGVGAAAVVAGSVLPARAMVKNEHCADKCKFERAVEDLPHGGVIVLVKHDDFYYRTTASFCRELTPEHLEHVVAMSGRDLKQALRKHRGLPMWSAADIPHDKALWELHRESDA